jgi:hypothetical protein
MNPSTNAAKRCPGLPGTPVTAPAVPSPGGDNGSDLFEHLAAGLDDLRERLERMEGVLGLLVEQRTAKEWYTTAEVAQIIGKGEYTVREYCRKGQVKAEKAANGRGWLISHAALTHLRNLGPTPENAVQRGLDR